jgi:hypothetical protein
MLTEDYIMRMISQALAVFMTALGLKKAGKYKEALQTFDQAVESLLGLNAHLVDQLEDSLLLDRLTVMGKLDVERLVVLADIYREETGLYGALRQPESSQFTAQRSLRLYLEAALASEANLDQALIPKIERLRKKIAIPSLHTETRLAVQDYLDRLLATNDEFLAKHGLSRSDLLSAQSSLDDPEHHTS